MLGTEGTLGFLHFSSKLLDCSIVAPDVFTVFLLEEFDEVLHHTLVKVLST